MNPYYYVLSVNGLLFLLSVIFYFFSPKKINSIYGYRTPKAKKNNTIWKFANATFNKQFVIYAAISLVAALILAKLGGELTWRPMALVFITILIAVIKTEQEIAKNFDEDGNKK